MPFKSNKQRIFLALHKPDVAHKFAMDSKDALSMLKKKKKAGGLKDAFGASI